MLSYEGHDVIASNEADCAVGSPPTAVDPQSVPKRTLYTGAKIPVLGLGTFGSDRFTGEQIAEAVLGAAAVGYRHFDCASVYGNEAPDRSFAPRDPARAESQREDLWVTSKLWNDKHGEADVIPSCEQSLRGPAARLPGSLPRPLAVPELPSARLRCRLAQPGRQAVHPRELHEDLAADGGARRSRAGAAHRHVEHDDPQADARAPRRPDQAGLQRDGAASPFPAARALPVRRRPGHRARSATARSARPTGPSATGPQTDTVDIEDPVIVRIADRLGVHPGRRVREVGRPARAGAHPLLRQAAAVPEQPEGRRPASRSPSKTCGTSPRSTGTAG